jgi:hypothetical protein
MEPPSPCPLAASLSSSRVAFVAAALAPPPLPAARSRDAGFLLLAHALVEHAQRSHRSAGRSGALASVVIGPPPGLPRPTRPGSLPRRRPMCRFVAAGSPPGAAAGGGRISALRRSCEPCPVCSLGGRRDRRSRASVPPTRFQGTRRMCPVHCPQALRRARAPCAGDCLHCGIWATVTVGPPECHLRLGPDPPGATSLEGWIRRAHLRSRAWIRRTHAPSVEVPIHRTEDCLTAHRPRTGCRPAAAHPRMSRRRLPARRRGRCATTWLTRCGLARTATPLTRGRSTTARPMTGTWPEDVSTTLLTG